MMFVKSPQSGSSFQTVLITIFFFFINYGFKFKVKFVIIKCYFKYKVNHKTKITINCDFYHKFKVKYINYDLI